MNKEQALSDPESDFSPQKIHIIPAFLSFLLPGVGQLVQKRWWEAFIFLILFVLSVLPVFCSIYSLFYTVIPDETIHDFMIFFILIPFPILTLFYAVVDAACSRRDNPFPLAFQVKWLWIVFLLFYLFLFFILPQICTAREAARRMNCTYNLKFIMSAFLEYHDVNGSFPPVYTIDSDGRPLHSWRVLLLPYLGEEELYKKIHLNEPWNSEYNRQFHHLNHTIWQCPSNKKLRNLLQKQIPSLSEDSNCCYSVIVGPDATFSEEKTRNMSDFYRGSDNTFFVVERLIPVCWMDPTQEISSDIAAEGVNRTLYGLGSSHSGGCDIAMANGSVRFISNTIDQKLLKEMLISVKNKKIVPK